MRLGVRLTLEHGFPKAVMRELLIEAVGGQGDGVCRRAADPIFAPLTLPGERVLAEVAGDRAEVIEMLEQSADRVSPPCPHFGACGGCALQHWRDEPYLEWKRQQIIEALGRAGITAVVEPPFSPQPSSRRRLALHARRQDGQVCLGFKARRTWRLIPIDTCFIAHPRLNRALPALRALAEPFFEHALSAPSLHVTWTTAGVDVEVSGVEARSGGLSAAARSAAAGLAAQADLARLTLAGEILYQVRRPTVRLGKATVALPPGGFLQASSEAESAMAAFVAEAADGAGRIVDLYCGLGTFTFRLAEHATVAAYDSSAASVAALMASRGGVDGLGPIEAQVRDLVRRPLSANELAGVGAVVFDPPRAGALVQASQIAASKVDRVIAVSCNPASFARDARVLVDGGYVLRRVLPVDQFVFSPHIELVASFTRTGRRR